MRLTFLLVFTVLFWHNILAQSLQKQSFSTAGTSALSGNTLVQSTIGQPALVGSSTSQTSYVSQGFQAGQIYVLSQKLQAINYQLYPNPAQNSSRLVVEGHSITQVKLLTATGQVINQEIDSRGYMNLSQLNSGVYFLQAKVAGQFVNISKLIVLR